MQTFFDPGHRARIVSRLGGLAPDAPAHWGRMTAPQMVAHLTDQMRHTLGDALCRPVPGPMRNAVVRYLSIYWVPWPKGVVRGPPDAFVTEPTDWGADLEVLRELVHRFGRRDPQGEWPEHALFGPMTGRDWGFFCHKHFNHHLTQFGV